MATTKSAKIEAEIEKVNRGTCTSTHYVRVDFLEQVVLGEIKRLTKFASRYEDDFVKSVMGSTQQNVALDRKLKGNHRRIYGGRSGR